MDEHSNTLTHIADAASVGIVVATIAQWLPAIAALMSIIWTAIRIYETKTVQKWVKKWTDGRK